MKYWQRLNESEKIQQSEELQRKPEITQLVLSRTRGLESRAVLRIFAYPASFRSCQEGGFWGFQISSDFTPEAPQTGV